MTGTDLKPPAQPITVDENHLEFYFPDGNIVIAAHTTSKKCNRPRGKNMDFDDSDSEDDSEDNCTHDEADSDDSDNSDGVDGEPEDEGEEQPKSTKDSATTTRRILFKVHKSVLASASKVFADMLELAGGTNASSDTHDGVPLVFMPDAAEDIEVLIDTMYGASFTRLYVLYNFET